MADESADEQGIGLERTAARGRQQDRLAQQSASDRSVFGNLISGFVG